MEQHKDCKSGLEFGLVETLDLLDEDETTRSLNIKDEQGGPCNPAPSIEHFCRVCGSEVTNRKLILIFGKCGKGLALQKKIFDHLHLEVKRDDHLPQKICITCISHLNTWEHFLDTSRAAAAKLSQLFLPSQIQEDQHGIKQDINGFLSGIEQDLLDSNITEGSEVDGSIINNNDDTNTNELSCLRQPRQKEKQRTPVLCHICGKAFKDMTNLHSHKRTHLPEDLKKKFQCTLCIKSFRTNFHLSEHMNMHLNVTPYACPVCDKQFHSRALLRQHAQVHRTQSDDRHKVACPKCGILCSRKGNLRAHLRTHQEGRTFDCCLCQKQFPSFSEMLSHRKQHSQDEIRHLIEQDLIKDKDRITTCPVCNKIFTDKRILATHVERFHNGAKVKKHECTDCGKVLHSQRSLVYHRRSQHTGERPYCCSYCGEGFLLLKLLKAHETKHTGERPFKCDICGKGFRSRNNLHQHSQKHSGERKFKCVVCGKTFLRKGALEVHSRAHSGEKPFVCDQCGRGFAQKIDLLKHQKAHQEESSQDKSRTCHECVVVFSSKKELLRHKEESHRDKTSDSVSVVPLIVTNNMYETHVITEDGQNIVFPTIDGTLVQNNILCSITNIGQGERVQ